MLGATVKDVPSRRAHTKCVPSGTEAVAEKQNTTPPKSLPGLRIEAGFHEILYTMNVDSTVFMLPMHASCFVFTNELLKFYLCLGYVVLVIFGLHVLRNETIKHATEATVPFGPELYRT